ncbi:hypothetical protein QBC36DRAFT_371677 [Triangularia setosa]|uniref:Uncharacterized protein n=1 Tax=Triangularia setosa TaxID=2587417 RepID=A0AAN7A6U1_9PEZI|nr:hypothetical protein QBC36DRAFT_371677 [Podospora setosa]
MTRGRFSSRPTRRRHLFPLPAFYFLLLLCIISWTVTHTTASWEYTTYNTRHHPQRHHPRDTYTPFPNRVAQQAHHNSKRNGVIGMGFMEMMGRARGQGVAVTRPLDAARPPRYVRRMASTIARGNGNKHHSDGDNISREDNGGGRKYGVVRLDDATSPPVGFLTGIDDAENEELKRGRMVVVEEVD